MILTSIDASQPVSDHVMKEARLQRSLVNLPGVLAIACGPVKTLRVANVLAYSSQS